MVLVVLWIVIVIFLVPAIFQWLWNITCPQVFRLPSLTYWQAFRLMIIAGLLFGSSNAMFQSNGVGQMIHFGL